MTGWEQRELELDDGYVYVEFQGRYYRLNVKGTNNA